jgi:hypothetical protein
MLADLRQRTNALAPAFTPERERAALVALMHGLLETPR